MKRNKNIKEGYKKTAVGVIPEEWEVKKLKSQIDIDKENLNTSFNEEYINYVSLSDIENGRIYPTRIEFKNAPSRARRITKKGDVLLATVRPNLKNFGFVDQDNVIASTGFAVLSEKRMDMRYLYNFLYSEVAEKQFYAQTVGSNYPALNSSDVKNLKLPIPPLPEQEAIANCLTTWDSGIEKLTQLIAAKREQKKGLMQQLLTGKKRLKGFVGEWKTMRFKDFSNIVRGGSPRPISEYITTRDDGLNWLRIGDIDEGSKYIYGTEEKIKIEGLNKTRLIKEGELILSNSMSFGRPFILKTECCIHDGWLAITEIADFVDREFLYYLISEKHIQSRFEHLAAGSGVRNLNRELISSFPIKLPPHSEQKAITTILSTADKEISLLEKKLAAMKEEKKGLMQVLLTGEKRLIDN